MNLERLSLLPEHPDPLPEHLDPVSEHLDPLAEHLDPIQEPKKPIMFLGFLKKNRRNLTEKLKTSLETHPPLLRAIFTEYLKFISQKSISETFAKLDLFKLKTNEADQRTN